MSGQRREVEKMEDEPTLRKVLDKLDYHLSGLIMLIESLCSLVESGEAGRSVGRLRREV
jgi:hypothetical protein